MMQKLADPLNYVRDDVEIYTKTHTIILRLDKVESQWSFRKEYDAGSWRYAEDPVVEPFSTKEGNDRRRTKENSALVPANGQ